MPNEKAARIVLDQADLTNLMRGEVIQKETADGRVVEAALADIGFGAMARSWETARDDILRRKWISYEQPVS